MRRVPARPALAVVLALLAALAGCSLIGGSGPSPPSPSPSTSTTTTTPTTTATTPATTGRLDPAVRPPGVDATALADPDALLAAHAERLTADGYGYELRINATTSRTSGGETRLVRVARRSVAYVEPGGAEYQRTLVNAGTGVRFDVWGNRTTELVRVTVANATRYRVADPPDRRTLTAAAVLAPYLRSSSFTVAALDREGDRTLVTLTARGLASDADPAAVLPSGASNVSGYRARLVVDLAGRIHRLTATGGYDLRGERATFRIGYRLTATEGVSVGRPGWVGAVDWTTNGTTEG